MSQGIGRGRALANAGFVLAVLGLSVAGTAGMARRQWHFRKTFIVRADFGTVGGVAPGHRVRLQGIDAGVVDAVVAPSEPGGPVRLLIRVDEKLRALVREDARARIVSEGVVGAKVVEIVPGRPDAPPLNASGVIGTERSVEISDLMARASTSLDRVNSVAEAAREGLGDVNAVVASVRKGEGSLGKLVRDDEAYRKLISISTRGERTLGDLEENLAALKRTWPLSRYFNSRSFFDRDLVLFHPGATRDARTLREDELFEPGRSTLTRAGQAKLDNLAAWFNKAKRSTSEVVIAAFTDDPRDADLAQILTQEQADAVRKYLVGKYAIDSAGWFSTRKVAAVGFGTDQPRTLDASATGSASRRVEIILFTPQA